MEKANGTLVVYLGEQTETTTVQVPDVMGMSAAAANQVLVNAGLNVRITGTKQHLTGSAAQVVRQTPSGGESASLGDVVTLVFSGADERE